MNNNNGLFQISDEYTIREIIRDTFYYTTLYAVDAAGLPRVVRVFKTGKLRPSEITLFRQEYEKLMNLEINGLPRILETGLYQGRPAVVYEFYEPFFLSDYMLGGKSGLEDFFRIAISLTGILADLHRNNITCLDLRPDNIAYEGDSLKIIDFGSSLIITRKNEQLFNEDIIKNSLPYISPEQTGRINRTPDYRSDLYSLGIILYELLIGSKPFASADPMELIHSHIARMPLLPGELDSRIAPVLSRIVMRLLEKSPEDRYRNAGGLLSDLVRCANQLTSTGQIDDFNIGLHDLSPEIIIPGLLVGRDKETELLTGVFNRTFSSGRDDKSIEVVFIYGGAGCGKSALIDEVRKIAAVNRTYFLAGRHQENQHNTPYSALAEALSGMIKQILSESSDRINLWKETLTNALGENGKLITDILPPLELLTGRQSAVPELSAEASQNRLVYTFMKLIRALASLDNGLVLAIDDIQWMDSASSTLLKNIIINRDISRLMIILSYRADVKDGILCTHELPGLLKQKGVPVIEIGIGPLTYENTKTYIKRIVLLDENDAALASGLVHKKTCGNPLYITQIIKSLHESGALYFKVNTGWHFDPGKINEARIPDTVIGLFAERIAQLPDAVKKILGICSCLGLIFDIDTAGEVGSVHVDEVFSAVRHGVDQGIIVFHENGYYFAHDRIREAFYSAIPDDEKSAIHLKAGKVILKNASHDKADDLTDVIVNHFQAGLSAVTSESERRSIAALNISASKKALSRAAYESALVYVKTAVSVTVSDCWEEDYDFALLLYTTAAEASFLSGDFAFMKKMTETALAKIILFMDKIPVYELVIQAHYALNRMQRGIEEGLSVLRQLKNPLPENPSKLHVIKGLVKTRMLLKRKIYSELLLMKEMTIPETRAVMKISNTMGINAYKTRPRLVPLIVFSTVELSVKYGNAPETAYSFAAYGMILCAALGDIDAGFKYGTLALKLSDRPEGEKYKPRTIHLIYCMIWHWKNHLRDTIEHIQHAYTLGMEMGDIEDATSSAHLYCVHKYLCGYNLGEVITEMLSYDNIIKRFRQETNLNYLRIERQALINLREKSADPVQLEGEAYSESKMLLVHEQAGDKSAIAILFIMKTINAFLFGRYGESVTFAEKAGSNIDALMGLGFIPVLCFYDSLARLALYDSASPAVKKKLMKSARSNMKQLRRWAAHAPMNHSHKIDLVQAELFRVTGAHSEAMRLYDRAADRALENGYIQESAVASESAARFYLSLGYGRTASAYAAEARDLFLKWGALSKADDMEQMYPGLLSRSGITGKNTENKDGITDTFHEPTAVSNPALDFYTVVEALKSISGEIVLDSFIDHVMKLIIKNAGASRGVLLVSRNDEIYAAAEGLADSSMAVIKKPVILSEYSGLPHSVINFTARTGESVVLANAVSDKTFSMDEYFRSCGVKSVLCQPLVNQQKLKGIIYLENSLATDVFSTERMELVKLLSAQAAISLDNAILFERTLSAESEIQQQYEEMQSQFEEMESMNEELHSAYTELDLINSKLAAESSMLSIFRQMADSSVQGMAIADMKGNVTYMNTAMGRMIDAGVDQDAPGRKAVDYYPESERSRLISEIVPEVLKSGQWVEEVRFSNNHGEKFIAIQSIFLLREKNGTPIFFATIITDITNLKDAENTLRESEERYRILVETMNDGLCVVDREGFFTYLNKSLCRMLGYDESELLGKRLIDLLDNENRKHFEKVYSKRMIGENSIYELEWLTRDAGKISTIVSPKSVFDSEGSFMASFAVITNITDKKIAEKEKDKIQAQLLHSQKMEAIGTLAGGIAHDFNNMLTSIFGNTDLLLLGIDRDDPKYSIVREIADAAEKSASLTRQLLAFSRKQIIETTALDLNSIILDMEKILKRLIGEDIELLVELDPDDLVIRADKSQVEQIILNLVVNARDAMPDGGRLKIATCSSTVEKNISTGAEAKPGRFVQLRIEDTGCGMSAELQKNIFEPFFTTKESNKGTGLGLAVVYGIVRQHEGWVHVESETGRGSCFRIYLPGTNSAANDARTMSRQPENPVLQRGSGERILLVEDQEDVRKFVKNALTGFGYNVFQAQDIKSAMQLFEKESGRFDLLLSDIVLPDGRGIHLADSLLESKPGLKIILSSGYAEQKFQFRLIQEKHYNFLPKPYTLNSLLEIVRRVIDGEF
ncbi:MAG TPA: PAS domain S-box protein [Spirochaetota bacterium]|nr:PAS domain S-box protein [Spirochaetota bacterium]